MSESDENHNPWEKWRPRKTAVDLAEIYRIYNNLAPGLIEEARTTGSSWSVEDIRRAILDEYGGSEISIKAQAEVARGTEPALIIPTYGGADALHIAFQVDSSLLYGSRNKFFAEVEVAENEVEKVRIIAKPGLKVRTRNHVVVSQGLTDKFGINKNDTITISDVYQDFSDVNLDEML